MPRQTPPQKRPVPAALQEAPGWVQEPLMVLDDRSLRQSRLIRVTVTSTLDGGLGIQELGYEILDLEGDTTLALAHNVIPGCPWDHTTSFEELAGMQHLRAKRLLLPF